VIETTRGHHLGRVISEGTAEPDTGIPGEIGGYTVERVLRTMKSGKFHGQRSIGDHVAKGSVVAVVDDYPVIAQISGMLRGLLRDNIEVRGMKVAISIREQENSASPSPKRPGPSVGASSRPFFVNSINRSGSLSWGPP
jgi:hypothetical protein